MSVKMHTEYSGNEMKMEQANGKGLQTQAKGTSVVSKRRHLPSRVLSGMQPIKMQRERGLMGLEGSASTE